MATGRGTGRPRLGAMAKPTMKDVAARAGVDTSTVSRALNEHTRDMLSADTVDRVLAAAEELGYRPNVLARGLRTQRSGLVGMVVPDLTNPFFPPIVRGLEDTLGAENITLIVVNTDNDADRERSSLQSLVGRQVDGLVLATSHIDYREPDVEMLPHGLPLVLVNRRSPNVDVSFVVPDDDAAVHEVVEYLVQLGHTRLAHLAGPQAVSTGKARLAAFMDACRRFGIEAPAVETTGAFVADEGTAACQRLLEAAPDVTAIFAANDLIAVGALRALRGSGRVVPDDVSLVGYNDMPLVDLIDPPLTTVAVPQVEMGRTAGRLLLAQLDPDVVDEDRLRGIILPSRLVVRRSTAAPS